ncbi:hypothetical protein CNYM01_05609 [Colletotrichum nymphaeae SA-01]|uniref:3-beta hydroxysteroid dehydrogenase/isomerase domain-containing protein n=1 Tax=Colletotrichum nymphaeae SA-01 TaxID=1460502 RepID=A0A135SXW7_9PEZI|nr:hypothetical protein CNYM01_05609 [Colletotrichum nymphaeae SA-01]
MRQPKVFLTGVSGYVGGHLFVRLVQKHPEWNYSVLVRTEKQAVDILAKYPDIEVVIGDLDNKDILVKAASTADIVLQLASADHLSGAVSLVEGLSQGQPAPGKLIHISGTGMVLDVSKGFGIVSDRTWNDVDDIEEITSLPLEGHVHRDVDEAVLEAGERLHVPVAIISPCTIHGLGQGPLKSMGFSVGEYIEKVIDRGRGFQVAEAQNQWHQIHIDDCADAFILLAEEAAKPDEGKAQWGRKGYYFAESSPYDLKDIAETVAQVLYKLGKISSQRVDKLSQEDVSAIHPIGHFVWGGNSKARGDRLRALGWKPTRPDILATLPEVVKFVVKLKEEKSTIM